MENKNNLFLIAFVAIAVLLSWGLTKDFNERQAPSVDNVCKQDSLQKIINSMQIDVETLENGFDSKERRYEEILFQYELGLNHIEKLYPDAFKEMHRVIAHKEYFTHESMYENKKRLKFKDEYSR